MPSLQVHLYKTNKKKSCYEDITTLCYEILNSVIFAPTCVVVWVLYQRTRNICRNHVSSRLKN